MILISVDTLRSDYLTPYGSEAVDTPNLAALAEESVLFEDALTPVPMTLPAHATMLTGLHPIQHGVRDNFNYIIPEELDTLPERFRDAGYATAGVAGAIVLSRRTGIAQGFDYYNDEFDLRHYQEQQPIVERIAEEVNEAGLQWLQTWQETQQEQATPFFLFLHYYDPHMLYRPPSPFREMYEDNPYAGEVAYVDHCLGVLFDQLKEWDLYDETLIVFTADHGEGLGDHVEQTHGIFLYEETVHVPLMFKLPKSSGAQAGRRVRQLASLKDIPATLVELCGLAPMKSEGISLAPWLSGETRTQLRALTLETQYPLTFQWSPLFALRDHEWKYIHAPEAELYHLPSDLKEQRNQYVTHLQHSGAMRNELEQRLLELADYDRPEADAQLSSEQMQALASLGYVGGGAPTDTMLDANLPDPKDMIHVYLKIDSGLMALMQGAIPRAIDMFYDVRNEDPGNPAAYANLGLAYAYLQDWMRAIEYTRQGLDIAPDNVMIQMQLARLYISSQDWENARAVLEEMLEALPTMAEAHVQLGGVAMQEEKPAEALEHFQEAQRWMPDMPGLDERIQEAQAALN